jgi:hypothetical protein
MIHGLPAETGMKTRTGLMERRQKMFLSSDVDSDSRIRMEKHGHARSGEMKMLKTVSEEAFTQEKLSTVHGSWVSCGRLKA